MCAHAVFRGSALPGARVCVLTRAAQRVRVKAAISLRVGAVLNSHNVRNHFLSEISNCDLADRLDPGSIHRNSTRNGVYVILASVEARDPPAADRERSYRALLRIKRAFRMLQAADVPACAVLLEHGRSTRLGRRKGREDDLVLGVHEQPPMRAAVGLGTLTLVVQMGGTGKTTLAINTSAAAAGAASGAIRLR